MAKVTFDDDRCQGCGLCEVACPKNIVKLRMDKLNSKGFHPAGIAEGSEKDCIACAFCATMCPQTLIKVEK